MSSPVTAGPINGHLSPDDIMTSTVVVETGRHSTDSPHTRDSPMAQSSLSDTEMTGRETSKGLPRSHSGRPHVILYPWPRPRVELPGSINPSMTEQALAWVQTRPAPRSLQFFPLSPLALFCD